MRERDVFRWVVLVSDHDLMRILWLSGSGWLTMSLIVDLDLSDCLDKNTEMWIFFFCNNLKQFQHSCSAPVVLLPADHIVVPLGSLQMLMSELSKTHFLEPVSAMTQKGRSYY